MFEVELPGVLARVEAVEMEEYRKKLSDEAARRVNHGRSLSSLSNDELVVSYTAIVSKAEGGSKWSKHQKDLFRDVLQGNLLERNDLDWALYHHMRLLNLSESELKRLKGVWNEHAGTLSFESMVQQAIPGHQYDDLAVLMETITLSIRSQYDGVRESLRNFTVAQETEPVLSSSIAMQQRLIAHLKYAKENVSERNLYPKDYFEQWIRIFKAGTVAASPGQPLDRGELIQLELEHAKRASDMATLAAVFQFVRHGSKGQMEYDVHPLLHREEFERERTVTDLLDPLCAHIRKRLRLAYTKRIRSGVEIRNFFNDLDAGRHGILSTFGYLSSWEPWRHNYLALRTIESHLDESPTIAYFMSFASLSFLNGSTGEEGYARTIREHPEFFARVWCMGLRTRLDGRTQLLEAREVSFKKHQQMIESASAHISDADTPPSTYLSEEEFNRAFPLDTEPPTPDEPSSESSDQLALI